MLPRSEVWYMDPHNIRSKNILKLAYPNGIKSCEIWITETQMIFRKRKKYDTNSIVVDKCVI